MKACINVLGLYASAYFDMGSLMKVLEISWAKPMDMQCILPFEGGVYLIMAGFASIGHLRGAEGLRELLFESDVSAVGSVKQNLSGKSILNYVMWLFILCLFLNMLWVGPQCVFVAVPGHTHLLLNLHFLYSSWKLCSKINKNFL